MFITVKKQSKKECISLLIEHALIIWDKIKTLQVLQQAKKAPDAWSQHETTHTQKKNNQEKVINLNYFLFMLWWLVLWFLSCILFCTISTNFHTLSTGIFTRDQFASIKSCKPCQWSHDLCDRSGIFKHPNDSLQWMILLFSYIKCFLSNCVKPLRVL